MHDTDAFALFFLVTLKLRSCILIKPNLQYLLNFRINRNLQAVMIQALYDIFSHLFFLPLTLMNYIHLFLILLTWTYSAIFTKLYIFPLHMCNRFHNTKYFCLIVHHYYIKHLWESVFNYVSAGEELLNTLTIDADHFSIPKDKNY